jgi:hypothetical protein
MPTARPRRNSAWAVVASLAAHLAVLAVLLTHRWDFVLPEEQPDSPWEHIVTVELAPHARAPASVARPTAMLGRAPRPGEQAVPLPSPPGQPAASPPPQVAQPAPSQAPSLAGPSAGGSGAALAGGGDLGAVLRHGVLGCAGATNLSRTEREACEDKLGAGAKRETALAEGRDPRIQVYFDAVAKAKAPDKPWTPIRARGGGRTSGQEDLRAGDPRASNDHIPMVGCAIPFGPGEKRKLPAHWLKLGPCFIAPPKGPFTVEADITPPDQDLSHPAPRSGPQAPPKVRHENAASADASGATLARDKAKNADGEKPPQPQ